MRDTSEDILNGVDALVDHDLAETVLSLTTMLRLGFDLTLLKI